MSNRTVSITLTAKDGISKTFKSVGDAGKRMGDELARSADQAEKELEQLGDTAEQTGRSMRDMTSEARNLGLGIGVLVSGMALAGKSYRDQEIALDALRRGYGDTADEMIAFTDQLQATTNYSNDQAVASANIARTLALNYGFTFQEIQQVLQISADLAAATGYAFEDATMRVVSALRGEAESAEMLGLTMNQAAIDSQNLTLTMSNQEAAHFRLNALIDQSAFAMGAAAEQADTTYGAMTDLRDGVQDAGQAFGEFLGPLGEIGAFAADNAVQIGLMSIALGQLGRAALAANAMIGMSGLGGSLARLAPLLGPAGGITLGLGLVAADLMIAADAGEDSAERMEKAAAGFDLLRESVNKMAETDAPLTSMADDVVDTLEEIERLTDRYFELEKVWADGDLVGDQAMEFSFLKDQLGNVGANAEYVGPALIAVNEILNNTGKGSDYAREALANLDAAFDNGQISAEAYFLAIIEVGDNLADMNMQANESADGMAELNRQILLNVGDMEDYNRALGQRSEIRGQEALETQKAIEAQRESNLATQRAAEAYLGAGKPLLEYVGSMKEAVDESEALEAAQQALADTMDQVSSAYTATTDALAAGFRTAVGNTNAIASQSQAVADWAEELIAAEGVYSKLDDLVAAGRITGESGVFSGSSEYAQAQQAYNDIIRDNADIQEHILTIQAKQAPVMAELVAQQEAYLESVANMGPEAQMLAVAYMDTATASQALGLAQAFIADQDTFGPMLEQLANANPYLAAILEDMGLIEQQPDKTWKVSADVQGQSEIETLTAAIETLTMTLWVATIGADITPAEEKFLVAFGLANDYDAVVAVATADVDDNASSTLEYIQSLLNSIDGRAVYNSVFTSYANIGATGYNEQHGGLLKAQHGRMIGAGVYNMVGENGPEIILGGNHIVPHTASKEMAKGAGFSVNVTVDGNVYGIDDLSEEVSRAIVPAIERAYTQHARGYAS